MNAYEQKKAERIERMRARAGKLATESAASLEKAHQIGSHIPLGQPILVGHHSERRHRRDIARIDSAMRKGVEAHRESEALAHRADSAEASTAVSSDDPDAVAKLREKLVDAEALHARTLEANAKLRAGASNEEVETFLRWPAGRIAIWQSLGHKTIPTTGSSADIRRIKTRIAELEARAVRPAEQFGDVRVVEEENRVRIFFTAKPDDAKRAELKAKGFRWSPTAGAWQRHASETAWYYARKLAQ
jgi:hypothetical protein